MNIKIRRFKNRLLWLAIGQTWQVCPEHGPSLNKFCSICGAVTVKTPREKCPRCLAPRYGGNYCSECGYKYSLENTTGE